MDHRWVDSEKCYLLFGEIENFTESFTCLLKLKHKTMYLDENKEL